MKRFIISESEKKEIRKLYGLISEEDTPKTTAKFTGCTFNELSKDTEGYNELMSNYQNDHSKVVSAMTEIALTYMANVPELNHPEGRAACEAAFIKLRPINKDKQFVIIDPNENKIFVFDKDGNFKGGDWVLTGKDKENKNLKNLDYVKKSPEERIDYFKKLGYSEERAKELAISKEGTRYAASGIYQTKGVVVPKYAGSEGGTKTNLFQLYNTKDDPNNPESKRYTYAVHGVKPTAERLSALQKMSKVPLNKELTKEIVGAITSGCVNISEQFLTTYRELIDNAYLYIIKPDKTGYYVFNPSPLIDNNKCYNKDLLQIHQDPAT
jgi:hypothetical protein